MSELTGPGELVLPGPNGKAVASLRDYARDDMTCLRGQLRVFRNVNKHGGCAVFPVFGGVKRKWRWKMKLKRTSYFSLP